MRSTDQPVDPLQERLSMYHLKKDIMPSVYWDGLVKYVNNFYPSVFLALGLRPVMFVTSTLGNVNCGLCSDCTAESDL